MFLGRSSNGLRFIRSNASTYRCQHQRWLTLDGRHCLSNIWVNRTDITNAEPPKDEDGHGLLQRAGFLAPSASGFFHLLPLGLRVQDRLVKLIDKHMSTVGASKLALSSMCDQKLWQQSGRLQGSLTDGKHELMGVLDRKKSGFLLSPTHEESISVLVKPYIQSYRDLPLRLYQVTAKYRDELRPRQGLLRTKEFLMKDLYTFDATLEEALETYNQVRIAYNNLFNELGIPYLTAEADSGNIGGKLNHEYHYASPLGEDTVWTCNSCSYTANDEVIDHPSDSTQSNTSTTHSCPRCNSGTLTPTRTVEIGHTFHLGTRYSTPLDVSFQSLEPNVISHAQMGCHGIGVSRLLGTIANVLAAPTGRRTPSIGLRWPRGLAPFDVCIIAEEGETAPVLDMALIHDSSTGKVEAVVDDRPQDISWKLKRADLVGYPVVIVLGKKFKKEAKLEVFCRETGETLFVDEADVKETVLKMLASPSESE